MATDGQAFARFVKTVRPTYSAAAIAELQREGLEIEKDEAFANAFHIEQGSATRAAIRQAREVYENGLRRAGYGG